MRFTSAGGSRDARWPTLALATALMSGCSLFSSSAPVIPPLPELHGSIQPVVRWHRDVGHIGDVGLTPAVYDGKVYVAAPNGDITALDELNGRQIWQTATREALTSGVGAGGDLVLVGTRKGELLAFDLAGGARWRAQLSSEVFAPPQVTDGVVIVRTGDGRIVGLDAQDGKRRWMIQRSLPSLTLRTPSPVMASRGAVFAGLPGGKLLAISVSNGAVGWEASVAIPKGSTELERVSDVVGAPVIVDQSVCAVAFQGRAACFDVTNGNALWTRDISSTGGLAEDAARLFVADDRGIVQAMNRTTGVTVWKEEGLSGRHLSPPGVSGDFVTVGDAQGIVHFLSADDGQIVARIGTDGSPIVRAPLPLSLSVLVQTRQGGLYALSLP